MLRRVRDTSLGPREHSSTHGAEEHLTKRKRKMNSLKQICKILITLLLSHPKTFKGKHTKKDQHCFRPHRPWSLEGGQWEA